MTSAARVLANRRNAAKSTGPRTPEGKAIAAQNAVKHGLWARQAVIRDEDPAEFDLHRRRMLEGLAPDGPDQEALAERIVALWWRLKRAERMQDEALDYLIVADRSDDWVKHLRSEHDPSARVELTFGRVVARDFANARALDRLSMHERRIESSLYRTMNELRRLKRERKTDGDDAPCISQAGGPRGASVPARSRSCEDAQPTQETPCGVTTNEADSTKQSQLTEEGGHSPPCETDSAEQSQSEECSSVKCDVSGGTGPVLEDKPSCETKPIEAGAAVCSAPCGASVPARSESCEDAQPAKRTPCGVTTNGKRSQRLASGAVARAVLRARPRVAYHGHNISRSY